MKTTQYIIDVANLEHGHGKHKIHGSEYLTCETPKMQWTHTFSDLDQALTAFDQIKASPTAVAVSLVEWQCDGQLQLKTGSYSSRHCAPGAMIKKVVAFIERPFKQRKYAAMERYHEVSMGDWTNETCKISDYLVGGGNWLKWTPKTLGETA